MPCDINFEGKPVGNVLSITTLVTGEFCLTDYISYYLIYKYIVMQHILVNVIARLKMLKCMMGTNYYYLIQRTKSPTHV
jgi:hypothetical protein